ncbi:hypothetical protein CROQUDRAFT_723096 [Cronartium quercuum f. sp. fusiforme G11]|uniref:Uncharacterized protein n=1 Tax=Cronartium quercuum f. sp. fusiforme G11 TaxID=708437 RepID=A0A9P6NKU4_9BASI|nr:hypothetical protein CROQUDRAFT_723096 [Cronartium quercuum f. sp. fusiforme G11]
MSALHLTRLPNELIDMIISEYIHSNRGDSSDSTTYPRNGLAAPSLQLGNLACSSHLISKLCKNHTWKTVVISVLDPPTRDDIYRTDHLIAQLDTFTLTRVRQVKVDLSLDPTNVSYVTMMPYMWTINQVLRILMGPRIKGFELELSYLEPDQANSPHSNWTMTRTLVDELLLGALTFDNLQELRIATHHVSCDHGFLAKLINKLPNLVLFECSHHFNTRTSMERFNSTPAAFLELGSALASLTRLEHLTLLGPGYPNDPWQSSSWKGPLRFLSIGNIAYPTSRPLFEFVYNFRHTLKTLQIHEEGPDTDGLPDGFEKEFVSLESLTISSSSPFPIPYLVSHLKFCPHITHLRCESTRASKSYEYFLDTFNHGPQTSDDRLPWSKLENLVLGSADFEIAPTSFEDVFDHLPNLLIELEPLQSHVARFLPVPAHELPDDLLVDELDMLAVEVAGSEAEFGSIFDDTESVASVSEDDLGSEAEDFGPSR